MLTAIILLIVLTLIGNALIGMYEDYSIYGEVGGRDREQSE